MDGYLYEEPVLTLMANLLAVLMHTLVLYRIKISQQKIVQKRFILFYLLANYIRSSIYVTQCIGELLHLIKYKELDISLSISPTLDATPLDLVLLYSDYSIFYLVQIICLIQACNWLKIVLKRLPLLYKLVIASAITSSLTSLLFLFVDRFPVLLSIFSENILKFKKERQMGFDHVQSLANLYFIFVSCLTPLMVFEHIFHATKNWLSDVRKLKESHQKLRILLCGMSVVSLFYLMLVMCYIIEQHMKLDDNSGLTILLRLFVRIFYRLIPLVSIVVIAVIYSKFFSPTSTNIVNSTVAVVLI